MRLNADWQLRQEGDNWHLDRIKVGKDKDGNEVERHTTTYHASQLDALRYVVFKSKYPDTEIADVLKRMEEIVNQLKDACELRLNQ